MTEAETSSTNSTVSEISPLTSNGWCSLLTKCLSTVMHYAVEILILFLLFTSYASLQKGALKVQLQPHPVPFFPMNSSVHDFYDGEISTPFVTIVDTDASFVMYYAPWDFDCQMVRAEFEHLANQFGSQVYFAAINCWHWHGECHQHFPRIRTFPLLLAYIGSSKGIQYRGPLQGAYMSKFLEAILRPLERVNRADDLDRLLVKSNAVLTGYFDFRVPKPLGFKSFYLASTRYLEYDVHRTVSFATITNPTAAAALGIDVKATKNYDIRLHLWNETLIYPHNGSAKLNLDRLLPWIYHRSHGPVQWLSPTGRKSELIQKIVFDPSHSSLVLFTKRLAPELASLMVLKEVALEYNNCGASPRIARLVRAIQNQRQAVEIVRAELEHKCSIFANDRIGAWCRCQKNSSCGSASSPRSVVLPASAPEEPCSFSSQWQPSQTVTSGPSVVQGLGCRTNRSLSFFAMDSELYPDFAMRLGHRPDLLRLNPTAAFIISDQDESHFSLNLPVTRHNLEDFVLNFTKAGLRRSRVSQPDNRDCDETERFCLRDLSADQFERTVLRSPADVLVFYRKSSCVFCDVAARVFLKTAHLMQQRLAQSTVGQPQLEFVTIDAERNDLPWQFTVHRYPTLVFYPAFRKEDSRAFSHDVELTVMNLLRFTMAQVHVKTRVTWLAHLCRDVACWSQALRRIALQLAVVGQHQRVLQARILRTDQGDQLRLLDQLRHWNGERRFYQQLNLSVLENVARFQQAQQSLHADHFADGIRFPDA